jgi:glyoxylase-like metal-dependent hydrolase (beta-lactamase superfamily II)
MFNEQGGSLMSHHPPRTRPAPVARFRHGAFECTVVSDGILEMGPARDNFPNANPAEVDALLTDYHLLPDNVRLNDNILVVDTGEALVQFDSGVGIDPEFGRGFFGPATGQVLPNLRDAGIAAADIDILAITHTHPDHVWGLVDVEGTPLYPNATIAVSREDFEFWTDLGNITPEMNQHRKDHFTGARKNLMPYADAGRIMWVDDGTELVPGITGIATPGHSPGHRVYRIESEGQTIICWGDLCHHQVLLLQHPEWSFQFDHDKPAATAQRHRIYDFVESNRYAVLAYHFPFPGLGHLRRSASGYDWIPSELPLELPAETIAAIDAGGTPR